MRRGVLDKAFSGTGTRSLRHTVIALTGSLTAAGVLSGCGSGTGVSHCAAPLVTFSVHGHTYGGGCAAQYTDLGPVSVKPGETFTAHVPKSDYPLPATGDGSVVRLLSKSSRSERFRAIAPGTTKLSVLSGHCYRGPAHMSGSPLPTVFPKVWCTVLTVHVPAAN
jgi:hypothetical protein